MTLIDKSNFCFFATVTTSEEPVWISVEDSKFDVVRSELNASVIRKEAGWEGEEIPPRRPSNSTGRRMTQAFLDAKQHFADWRTAKRKPKPIRNTRGAVGLAEPLDRHRRRSLFSRQEKYQISVKRLRDIIDA